MRLSRKLFLRSLAGAGLATFALLSQAQAWPAKPVRLVVPFPAGGATDTVARVVAQQVATETGQQFIVDNKAGAGGTLGATEGMRAAADGYTLVFTTSSTHAISPHLMAKAPYDPVKDFTPIAHVADAASVLLIPTGLPHVRSGRLKALAVTGGQRSPLMPELPTVAEAGLPGFTSVTWFGLYGPARLPADVVRQINTAFNKALRAPEVGAKLAQLGAEPAAPQSPEAFATMVAKDSQRWGQLIRERKITVD